MSSTKSASILNPKTKKRKAINASKGDWKKKGRNIQLESMADPNLDNCNQSIHHKAEVPAPSKAACTAEAQPHLSAEN